MAYRSLGRRKGLAGKGNPARARRALPDPQGGREGELVREAVRQGLLPALFEHLNPMPYGAAQKMEQYLAGEIQEKGRAVWQA